MDGIPSITDHVMTAVDDSPMPLTGQTVYEHGLGLFRYSESAEDQPRTSLPFGNSQLQQEYPSTRDDITFTY
jgi:hypothetical protein